LIQFDADVTHRKAQSLVWLELGQTEDGRKADDGPVTVAVPDPTFLRICPNGVMQFAGAASLSLCLCRCRVCQLLCRKPGLKHHG